jgi:hypothetical protein
MQLGNLEVASLRGLGQRHNSCPTSLTEKKAPNPTFRLTSILGIGIYLESACSETVFYAKIAVSHNGRGLCFLHKLSAAGCCPNPQDRLIGLHTAHPPAPCPSHKGGRRRLDDCLFERPAWLVSLSPPL